MTVKKVEKEWCEGTVDPTGKVGFWLKNTDVRPGTLYGRLFVETNGGVSIFNFNESAIHDKYSKNTCTWSWHTPCIDSPSKINAITVCYPTGSLTVSVNPDATVVAATVNYSYEEGIEIHYGDTVLRSLDAPWMEQ